MSDSAISFELEPPPAEVVAQGMEAAGDAYPWLVAVGPRDLLSFAYRFAVEVSAYLDESGRGREEPGRGGGGGGI